MTSSFFTRTLTALAFATGAAGSLGGCCEVAGFCAQGGDETASLEDGDFAPPPVATAGCDPAAIATQNGGACATCTSDDGSDARICGEPDVARCNNQQNAFGEQCQRCATAAGEVLYDDCAVAAGEVGATRCEVTPGDPSQGANDGESECSVCFDDNGSVVSSSCEPIHDECHEVSDGGRLCRECTRDGQVVIYQCEGLDLDPSTCEVYENDIGRCVDCYSEDQALLSHQCQLFEDDALVSCVETVDPSGLSCVTCFDQNGTVLDSGCSTAVPEARACQVLEYSTQTCVVCVDDFGEPVMTDCATTGCTPDDPASCENTTQCAFERDDLGQLCRTCTAADGQGSETRCLTSPDLVCTSVPSSDLPPDPNAPGGPNGEPAPPQEPGTSCLVCSDAQSGVEVYRDCDAGGASQPPVCVDTVDEAGTVCTVCTDGYNGAPLYSTCDGGDTCFVTGDRALTTPAGEALVADNGLAVATCFQCGTQGTDANLTESDFAALCALPQTCEGPDGFVDPTEGQCPELSRLLVAPRACENGWAAYGATASTEAELLAVLSWTLDARGLALGSVAALAATVDATCDIDTCSACARGDLLEIAFAQTDAAAAREIFSGSLLSCQADADCPASALCVEGVCGL